MYVLTWAARSAFTQTNRVSDETVCGLVTVEETRDVRGDDA
jgi:hypothetical protein